MKPNFASKAVEAFEWQVAKAIQAVQDDGTVTLSDKQVLDMAAKRLSDQGWDVMLAQNENDEEWTLTGSKKEQENE